MSYWIRTPWLLRKFYPGRLVWRMPAEAEPAVYLTFDDGPHPRITPFILDHLAQYDAKATFFCIGKNVKAYPAAYRSILDAGHTTGNHTQHHLNGWKAGTGDYIRDITEAAGLIDNRIFRPPYGRIGLSQSHMLRSADPPWTIYMWDVLSGDFDTALSPAQCLENVITKVRPGSVVVFHDSEKAWDRMSYALPRVLEFCHRKNWKLKALPVPGQ